MRRQSFQAENKKIMKGGRPKSQLTQKEEEIMQMLWARGPMYVREIVDCFADPRPHRNTVATQMQILEQKGHVEREAGDGGVARYRAITVKDNVRTTRLGEMVRNFFAGSYRGMVSQLVKENKVSVDELRELIDLIERGDDENSANSKD